MPNYVQSAFDAVCTEAKTPTERYVCLVSSYQAYGGSEEGGWYYTVRTLEAYQKFPTEEAAGLAAEKIKSLAKELSADAKRAHGEYCLRSMEWLEARGLDADFLPEPDGEETYDVYVYEELPNFDNTRPSYE